MLRLITLIGASHHRADSAEPQASLLSGILLGQDGGIPPKMIDTCNRAGTSHIIAILG